MGHQSNGIKLFRLSIESIHLIAGVLFFIYHIELNAYSSILFDLGQLCGKKTIFPNTFMDDTSCLIPTYQIVTTKDNH